jgi:hypothetical protein
LGLSVKLPPKGVREKFLIIYELEGCQKAINYLTKYYLVGRMRVLLNGKRVRREWVACYFENQAYFKKDGLKKQIVLHELYHHLVNVQRLDIPLRIEEKEANDYARRFLTN